jgi:hypothetical protein
MLVSGDEAQLLAPAVAGDVSDEARKLSLGAMTNLMCRGRKRGLAGVIATQRLAKLAKNVAAEATNFLMGRTFLDIDMARAADLLGMERRQAEAFRNLERGEFVALGPALSRQALSLRVGATQTRARNEVPKLVPRPAAVLEDAHAVILAAGPVKARATRRMAPLPGPDLLTQLMATRPAVMDAPGEQAPDLLEVVGRRERMEAILDAILVDPEAGFRPVGVLYQDFLVRCRIAALGSGVPELAGFRRMMTRARAGIGAEIAGDEVWRDVAARAAVLPEDMQGIFMMLARAAREGAACPSDAAIARAYGTRSLGRARRVLAYMEEQGLIVCQMDGAGHRVVTLVELAWATAAGDPLAGDV